MTTTTPQPAPKKDRAYWQQKLDDNVTTATLELIKAQATFRRNIRSRTPDKDGRLITVEEAKTSSFGRRQMYGRLERAIRLAEDYRNGGKG